MDQNLEQEEADAGQDNINNNVNNNNNDVAGNVDDEGISAAEFIEFWRQHVNPDFNQDNLNELLQQYNVNNANELMQLHPFFNNLDEEDNEEHQEDVDGNEDSDSDDNGNEEVDINNDDDSNGESEG